MAEGYANHQRLPQRPLDNIFTHTNDNVLISKRKNPEDVKELFIPIYNFKGYNFAKKNEKPSSLGRTSNIQVSYYKIFTLAGFEP